MTNKPLSDQIYYPITVGLNNGPPSTDPHLEKQREWDIFFMGAAKYISTHSKCLSRKIGSVAVIDKMIVAEGYNGPPRGVPVCSTRNMPPNNICPRKALGLKSGEGLDLCLAEHSESNILASAARLGIKLKDSSIYIYANIGPCHRCLGSMINAGIKEIIIPECAVSYDNLSDYILKYSDIIIRRIPYEVT